VRMEGQRGSLAKTLYVMFRKEVQRQWDQPARCTMRSSIAMNDVSVTPAADSIIRRSAMRSSIGSPLKVSSMGRKERINPYITPCVVADNIR